MKIHDIIFEDQRAMDGKVVFMQIKPDQKQGLLGELTTVLDVPINQWLSARFNQNASYFNLRALDKSSAFKVGNVVLPSSAAASKGLAVDLLSNIGIPHGCLWTLIPDIQQRKKFLVAGQDVQKIDYQIRLEMLSVPSRDADYTNAVASATSLGSSAINLPFSSGTGKPIPSNDPNRLGKLKTDIYKRLEQAGDAWLKPLVSNLIR